MQKLKIIIAEKISEITDGALSGDEIIAMLAYPPEENMGDLALPCFKFAKAMRKSPVMIANDLAAQLSLDCLERIEAVNGYLNLFISKNYWKNVLIPEILDKKENYGRSDSGAGKTFVIDYSSPNICKPFHVGHLRSTIIGHSVKMLYDFCGWNTVGINYLGDWGTQFGKQIAAYKMWGNREEVEKGGVDALVSLYVRYNNEAEEKPEFNDMARTEFHKLEEGDPENTELWKWFVGISVAECEKTYKKLGVTFDSYAGEAFYQDKMDAQIEVMRKANILVKDQGAEIVDLSEFKMPPCLILKSDGSTLYPTRDIAAAVYRKNTYHFDKCAYVTAYQQNLHFAQWFKVIGLMGYDFEDQLVHVPYGMVSIGGAKLATRTGNVVLIKNLTDMAVKKALDIIEVKNPSLQNKEQVAEDVGIGAIVFYFLLNGRIKDIDLNIDDALSFEGNTGPYVQYTFARCSSVMEKAKDFVYDSGKAEYTSDDEAFLAKTLARYPEAVKDAAEQFEPSVMVRYILDLAVAFNRFYHACPVLTAENENIRNARLALTEATRVTLKSSLHLICMKTPTKI